jgi:hypothetical protein
MQHKKEIKKPLKPTGIKMQLSKLSKLGQDRAIAAIKNSIAQGWQGIYEEKQNQPYNQNTATDRLNDL